MKVKIASSKIRTSSSRQKREKLSTSSEKQPSFTITARVKRPDIVQQAEIKSTKPATATRTKLQTKQMTSGTRLRQQSYIPPGTPKKSNSLYWALGGIAGGFLFLCIIIIVANSGSDANDTPRPAVTTTQRAEPNVRPSNGYTGKGDWAYDPEMRARMESSNLAKQREALKKNYRKDR